MIQDYGFKTKKYNYYVDLFINLTDSCETDISVEFEEIANKYKKRRPLILGMMLEYAIISGRPDIVKHLLDLGADPNNVCENTLHELISDNDISKKKIKLMTEIFFQYGYKVDLNPKANKLMIE